jgi:hypothetical protein
VTAFVRDYVRGEQGLAAFEQTAPADGFYYDFALVAMGYQQWEKTGIVPDPARLAAIDPLWLASLNNLGALIAQARAAMQERREIDER